jgi:hypothetical protein
MRLYDAHEQVQKLAVPSPAEGRLYFTEAFSAGIIQFPLLQRASREVAIWQGDMFFELAIQSNCGVQTAMDCAARD